MRLNGFDSWYSKADESKPILANEHRSGKHLPAWLCFICSTIGFIINLTLVMIVAAILGWSVVYTVFMCLYGFFKFDQFAGLIQNCVANSGDFGNESFLHQHSIRLSIRLIYGLGLFAFMMLPAFGEDGISSNLHKRCYSRLGFIIAIVCVIGDVAELFLWPVSFNIKMENCKADGTLLWMYHGWPWYTSTLLFLVVFRALEYAEQKPRETPILPVQVKGP